MTAVENEPDPTSLTLQRIVPGLISVMENNQTQLLDMITKSQSEVVKRTEQIVASRFNAAEFQVRFVAGGAPLTENESNENQIPLTYQQGIFEVSTQKTSW